MAAVLVSLSALFCAEDNGSPQSMLAPWPYQEGDLSVQGFIFAEGRRREEATGGRWAGKEKLSRRP